MQEKILVPLRIGWDMLRQYGKYSPTSDMVGYVNMYGVGLAMGFPFKRYRPGPMLYFNGLINYV
ncbi:COBW domain-containing protein 1 isoform X2 [Iris pallida]|uniref:COBW domain-containing protein 1 isoform X2 n=1 Tax=Iris pallida TaxID=29817 RepID=A0AAX6HXW4_IRIPA|nr:COBW domain-containing protein 1 isoform X2 [Iris pallida]